MKKLWKLTKKLWIIGFVFWITETSYFMIKYGFHLKAINQSEKICDAIVSVIFSFCLGITCFLLGLIIDEYVQYRKEANNERF